MNLFSEPHISIAVKEDAEAIKNLLNAAYRGEASKKGWTTEAHLIEGETRTDAISVEELIKKDGSVFLKYSDVHEKIIGCVNLQQHSNKMYLGMFSVSPLLQGSGIGKKILKAAEEYAKFLRCTHIYMSVISVRTELIAWYKRHGYRETGEKKFFEEDDITGRHVMPLEFMMLEKDIAPKLK